MRAREKLPGIKYIIYIAIFISRSAELSLSSNLFNFIFSGAIARVRHGQQLYRLSKLGVCTRGLTFFIGNYFVQQFFTVKSFIAEKFQVLKNFDQATY